MRKKGNQAKHPFVHFPASFTAEVATLEVIQEENLIKNAQKMGKYFTVRLRELQKRHESIGDIRGPGLMIGIELVKNKNTKEPARELCHTIVKEAIPHGVIFGESKFKCLGNVLKIKPPLVISESQADKVLMVLDTLLKTHA
jgi:4-aminobutyrate aminotransferase/4-aminobutyrate aminotransferase/(S)-3-amino-2-methylpropionate transaminase